MSSILYALPFTLLALALFAAAAAVIQPRLELRPAAALFGAAFVLAFAAPAHANDNGTSVDLAPLLAAFAPYLVEGVVALALLVVSWVASALGLKEIEKRHREALDQALRAGAAWGLAKAREHAAGRAGVDVKNAAVAHALRYVLDATPDAIRKFGLTPDRVRELVEARLAPTPFEVEILGEGAGARKDAA